jgi:hypothetical protein
LKRGRKSLVTERSGAQHLAHEAEPGTTMIESTTDIRIVPLALGHEVLTSGVWRGDVDPVVHDSWLVVFERGRMSG